MRPLTAEEMDIVAGGDGTSITVTGTRGDPGTFFLPIFTGGGGNGGGASGGGGGGGAAAGYSSPGASAAANAFANAHVHKAGSTVADQHDYQVVHDDIAKLYDLAQSDPTAVIALGNDHYITAATAVSNLSNVSFNVSDSGGGPTGANTQPNSTYSSFVITINPENSNIQTYDSRTSGTDYVLFHEIGHVLNDISNPSARGDEGAADAAAVSLRNALGINLMSNGQ